MWFGPRLYFWGFNKNCYLGSYAPKPPHLGAVMGISSVNVESNNFRTSKPILVIYSSDKMQLLERNSDQEIEKLKFAYSEVNNKTFPKGSLPSEILRSIT
jgi:hypothetical protein